ncbi:hypothetical protein [Armatimonas sp.]|uniref:hypothetical protein n=1 Tax=Armatimonas sp. TaxID=1872638 RepID=UPI003751FA54
MRRVLAIFLVAVFVASSLPQSASARLICRMTGEEMQPVAVQDDPNSCCAVRAKSTGGMELANRSCCDLKITPGHTPLPSTSFTNVATAVAALTTFTLVLPIQSFVEVAASVSLLVTPLYRGPPPSPDSPRGPPTLS